MELSTSLNLLNCEPRLPVVQQLKILKDCGFRFFDMNFCDYNNPNSPLVLPGWEKWIMQIKDFADQEGLSFYQSHGHMFEFYPDDRENNALIDRTIAASGLLAVKWIVFHPYHQRSKMDDENQNRTGRYDFDPSHYSRYADSEHRLPLLLPPYHILSNFPLETTIVPAPLSADGIRKAPDAASYSPHPDPVRRRS